MKTLEERLKEIEGQHFVLEFSSDYTVDQGDGHAIEIFQARNGKLEEVWHPCDHAIMNAIGSEQSEKAAKYLQERGVKVVYTPGCTKEPNKCMGLTLDNFTDEDNWVEYRPLRTDFDYWKGFFQGHGIELKVFDEEDPPRSFEEVLERIKGQPQTK